jgi:TonB family protein
MLFAVSPFGGAASLAGADTGRPLDVRIVEALSNASEEVVATSVPSPLQVRSGTPEHVATAAVRHDAAPAKSAVARIASEGHGSKQGPALEGRVDIAYSSVYARLGEEVDRRAHAEFDVEIDRPVQLEAMPIIPYPPAALARGVEESLLAWIVVDPEGKVEEVQVENDTSEFKDAVLTAARQSIFQPAQNHGQKIRHYIMIEYRFRLGAWKPPVAAATRQADSKR